MKRRPVLVIDDDPRHCELVAAILTNAGFKVLAAPDGPSGIEVARTAQPAVILLDMMMPGLDGIGTCERLKRDPVLADIPVVGLTASADLSYTARAFRARANFFLQKPFSRDGLIRVVELAVETAQRGAPKRHQRQYPRFPAGIAVRCLLGADANAIREVLGTTGNASLGGLLLLLPERLPPSTVFGLRLRLPDRTVSAEAKVVWQDSQPVADGKFPHGIRLLHFGEGSALVGYRCYLSQIAAGSTP